MRIAWASTVGIISNIVLIASVVVLIVEIRQNQVSMLAQSSYERTQMAIANDQALVGDAQKINRKLNANEEITEDELLAFQLWNNQMVRYFENLHYLNSIDVLDDEIWEANQRGILSFCRRQKDHPDYPALSANDEFKFRSSFVEFFKASCGLDQ
jgi:hypothetical protein